MTVRYDPERHILLRDQAHKRRIHSDAEFAEYLRRVQEPSGDLKVRGSTMTVFDVEVPSWPPAKRSPLQMMFGVGGAARDPFADLPWQGVHPAVERDWWTDRATEMIAVRMVPPERNFDPYRLAYQWQVPEFDAERHVLVDEWCRENGRDLVEFLNREAEVTGVRIFWTTNPNVRAEAERGSYSPTVRCFLKDGADPAPSDPPPDTAGTAPVTGFTLVDVSNQRPAADLLDGAVVNVGARAGQSFGIRADTSPRAGVKSVELSLSGPVIASRIEGVPPYSLWGDVPAAGGKRALEGARLPPGPYALSATAYPKKGAGGPPLGTLTASFTIAAAESLEPEPAPEPGPAPAPAPDPARTGGDVAANVREISPDEAVRALRAALGRDFRLFGGQTADQRILAMERPALHAWLQRDATSRAVYVHENRGRSYDCDDFALDVKAALARTAGLNGCAIVWGDAHAWVAFLVHDGGAVEAVMVEPQTDALVGKCEGEYRRQAPLRGLPVTYATRADLDARFGDDEIDRLDSAGTRVAAALADASAEIDGYLARAYRLPLEGSHPALTGICCDLARARLYDDSPPERVTDAAREARSRLDDIRARKRRLLDADGAEAPLLTLPAHAGPEPVMTREALADY